MIPATKTLHTAHSPSPVRVYRLHTPDHLCPWGVRAVNLLTEKGIEFEDIKLTSQETAEAFKAQYQVATTPQIFFGEERIGGYSDLAEHFQVSPEKPDYSYTPVIALFSTAGLIALATSLGTQGFMGISLSMLASLKLMDVNAFAASFEQYDLLTKRFKPYCKIYPLIELLLGLGFLSGFAPLATGIGSLAVGVAGAASVFKAVYMDKLALNCACIGGNSKAPLGVISFAENMIMAVMGVTLIFSSTNLQDFKFTSSYNSGVSHFNSLALLHAERTNFSLLRSQSQLT
jgi:glutaredoxin